MPLARSNGFIVPRSTHVPVCRVSGGSIVTLVNGVQCSGSAAVWIATERAVTRLLLVPCTNSPLSVTLLHNTTSTLLSSPVLAFAATPLAVALAHSCFVSILDETATTQSALTTHVVPTDIDMVPVTVGTATVSLIATAGADGVSLHGCLADSTPVLLGNLHDHLAISLVSFTPCGRYLGVAASAGYVGLWHIPDLLLVDKDRLTVAQPPTLVFHSLCLSVSRFTSLVVHSGWRDSAGREHEWHRDEANATADGVPLLYLAVAAWDGNVLVWRSCGDRPSFEPHAPSPPLSSSLPTSWCSHACATHTGPPTLLALSLSRSIIAHTCSTRSHILISSLATGRPIRVVDTSMPSPPLTIAPPVVKGMVILREWLVLVLRNGYVSMVSLDGSGEEDEQA